MNPVAGLSLDNPWPQGYVVPTGNTLGPLQDVGYGVGGIFRNHPSGYVQEYLFGLQDAITPDDSLEVDYFGNHGIRMITGGMSHSQLNPKYLSMGAPALNTQVRIRSTVTSLLDKAVAAWTSLRSSSRIFCSHIRNTVAWGRVSLQWDSLFTMHSRRSYNHRFHKGLNVLVSYTFSKFFDNVEGAQNWAVGGNSSPANNYDLAAEKSVDASDTPQSLVVSYIYQLPIGKGRAIGSGFNRKTDAVLGGWQISGVVTSRSGPPVHVSGNNWNSYGGNPRPNVIGNTSVSNRSIKEWFNTAAFEYAPYGDFGNAPRYFSNVRSPAYTNFDTAIMKSWFRSANRCVFSSGRKCSTLSITRISLLRAGPIVDAIRIRTPIAFPSSDKSPRPFRLERCNGQVSSIGDPPVRVRLKPLLFVLLAISEPGSGQQDRTPDVASLLAAAQEAQARNDYATAEDVYEKAVKLRSDIPELWANLGLMQDAVGRYSDAIESFRRATLLNPALYVPNLFLGIDYIHINHAQKAIPFLVKAESINARDPQAPLSLGRAYLSVRGFYCRQESLLASGCS